MFYKRRITRKVIADGWNRAKTVYPVVSASIGWRGTHFDRISLRSFANGLSLGIATCERIVYGLQSMSYFVAFF
jgi:hypothetical protein